MSPTIINGSMKGTRNTKRMVCCYRVNIRFEIITSGMSTVYDMPESIIERARRKI